MKKNLLSLAVGAAMVVPAIASADVMVYGSAMLELVSTSHEATCSTAGASGCPGSSSAIYDDMTIGDDFGNSKVGVHASEDLGNGWTGLAQFEWRPFPDGSKDGGVNWRDREHMVGLKGKDVGQFELGRLKQAYKYTGGVAYDPFVATALQARGQGGMTNGDFGHGGFISNSIGYKGMFGPATVWVTYNPEDVKGGAMTASFKFKQDNWEAFVALADSGNTYASKDGGRTLKDGDAEYSATKIGGQFNMGMHTISAQYEMIDDKTKGGCPGAYPTGTACPSPTVLFVNYTAKVGNTKFVASIGQADSDGTKDTDIASASGAQVSLDESYLALGVLHYLSKTTRLHAGYRSHGTDTNEGDSVIAVGLRKDFK